MHRPDVLCLQGVKPGDLTNNLFKRYKKTAMLGQDERYSCVVLSRSDFGLTHHLQFNAASPVIPVIHLHTKNHSTPNGWLIGSFMGSDTDDIHDEIEMLTREFPPDNNLTLLGDFCRVVDQNRLPDKRVIPGATCQYAIHRPRDAIHSIKSTVNDEILSVTISS